MHVCVFVFDLLYVDGDSLVHLPLRQRRARLAAALPNLQPGHVQLATSMEFQPAAVSAAADAADAAASAAAGSGSVAVAVGTHSSISDVEADVNDETRSGIVSSARSSDSLSHHDDKEVSVGDRRADNLAHGGVDIDATDEAAAAAAEAAADASGAQEEDQGLISGLAVEGAADAEGGVSDLALQSIEDRIQEFLLESFAGGTEGLMLKALDVAAGYQPSKRSDSWIKLKRCHATAEQSLRMSHLADICHTAEVRVSSWWYTFVDIHCAAEITGTSLWCMLAGIYHTSAITVSSWWCMLAYFYCTAGITVS